MRIFDQHEREIVVIALGKLIRRAGADPLALVAEAFADRHAQIVHTRFCKCCADALGLPFGTAEEDDFGVLVGGVEQLRRRKRAAVPGNDLRVDPRRT